MVEAVAERETLFRRNLGEHDDKHIALKIDEGERSRGTAVLHTIGDAVGPGVEKIETQAVAGATGGRLPHVKGAKRCRQEQRRIGRDTAVAMEAKET